MRTAPALKGFCAWERPHEIGSQDGKSFQKKTDSPFLNISSKQTPLQTSPFIPSKPPRQNPDHGTKGRDPINPAQVKWQPRTAKPGQTRMESANTNPKDNHDAAVFLQKPYTLYYKYSIMSIRPDIDVSARLGIELTHKPLNSYINPVHRDQFYGFV